MHVCDTLKVSERRACKALGQYRSTQSHRQRIYDEEEQLTNRIIELAATYRRYGYRLITGLLQNEGWKVNHKRVERIWRREGLKVPKKQPKRERIWLTDGSCIRLRPEYKNHVWSYDFVTSRTHDGRAFRMLNIVDEFTRECLDITVERKITSHLAIERLAELFITRGIPEHIRSGVHCKGGKKMATETRCTNPFYRAGEPLGEWLRRIVQRNAQGRNLRRRDLHYTP
jgi:hypothetical protein